MNATELLSRLRTATRVLIGDEASVAVAYSGGLDSSIVAAISLEFAGAKCYTCATKGSLDSKVAEEYAAQDGVDSVVSVLSENDLLVWIRKASNVLGSTDPVRIAYTIPVLYMLEECVERCVLAGNGADELFGGYAKYSDSRDPKEMMAIDLEKMLQEASVLKARATSLGKRIGFPFVAEEVMDFAEQTPIEQKVKGSDRKLILREAARLMGLRSSDRPKKAAQYSSGILKEMRRISRRERLELSEWTATVVHRHDTTGLLQSP